MELRRLGRSELQVAPLCLGGNVFGWTADEAAGFKVLDAYAEGGGNFVDTADQYSFWANDSAGGESETIIGNWMHARGNRERVIVATKVGGGTGASTVPRRLARDYVLRAVEGSLRRLRTEYIDLYLSHFDDPDTPIEETLATFDELVRQGKVRAIGASNFSAERLRESLEVSAHKGLARYESLQPSYSVADRERYEREFEPLALERHLGVIPYWSLARGFLTGKYRRGAELPNTPRAGSVQEKFFNDHGFAVLDAVERVAQAHGATPAQVALAWLMARPGIAAPIASATSPKQVRELLGATELKLDPHAIADLDKASAP